MNMPNFEFVVRLNKARHDKNFQRFLARSFGQRFLAQDGTVGVIGYQWRGITYFTQELTNLPPSPPRIGPFPIDP